MDQLDRQRIARSIAIEEHANVEASLCLLFAWLMDVPNDKAAAIFFKLTNTKSRNAIIKDLVKQQLGDAFDTYLFTKGNGLWALMGHLDDRRNEIVHWHLVRSATSGGDQYQDLRPAYFWSRLHGAHPMDETGLSAFTSRARYVSSSLDYFARLALRPSKLGDRIDAWAEVFAVAPPENPTHEDFLAAYHRIEVSK